LRLELEGFGVSGDFFDFFERGCWDFVIALELLLAPIMAPERVIIMLQTVAGS
jgi:hypothetical protein